MSELSEEEKERAELRAGELLKRTAEAFDEFCSHLGTMPWWKEGGSVYNLLVTYDELRVKSDSDEMDGASPEKVLAGLARAGLVAGPYDEEGHVAQAVNDELLTNLTLLGELLEALVAKEEEPIELDDDYELTIGDLKMLLS